MVLDDGCLWQVPNFTNESGSVVKVAGIGQFLGISRRRGLFGRCRRVPPIARSVVSLGRTAVAGLRPVLGHLPGSRAGTDSVVAGAPNGDHRACGSTTSAQLVGPGRSAHRPLVGEWRVGGLGWHQRHPLRAGPASRPRGWCGGRGGGRKRPEVNSRSCRRRSSVCCRGWCRAPVTCCSVAARRA